jgi:hypothetical protein
MSWFFDAAPYILAIGAIVLAGLELARDWKEYKKKWARMTAAAVLVVVAAVSLISLYHDNKERKRAEREAGENMTGLRGEVAASEQAQESNTKLFLDSLGKMSAQVGDLKTEVRTDALQKKLAGVQEELRKTEQALAPGPKAELAFTFVPYPNTPVDEPIALVKRKTLPLEKDGSVHVEFTILNTTDVDAVEVAVNVQICDLCRFAKEPVGLTQPAGMNNQTRYLWLQRLHAKESYVTISVDVIPPPDPAFTLGFGYRCNTCGVPKKLAGGTVRVARGLYIP